MKVGCRASLLLCLTCSLWCAGTARRTKAAAAAGEQQRQEAEGPAAEGSWWPSLPSVSDHFFKTTYIMVNHPAIPKDDDFLKLMRRLERGVGKAEHAWYQRGEDGIFSVKGYVTSTTLHMYKAWRGSKGKGPLLCFEIHRTLDYLYQGWRDEMTEGIAAEWQKDFPDGAVHVSDTEKCPPNFVIDVTEAGDPRVKGLWVETLESHRDRPVYTSYEHPKIKMEWSNTRDAWRIYDDDAYQLLIPGLARKTLYANDAKETAPPEEGWYGASSGEADGIKPEGAEPFPKLKRLDVMAEEDPEDIPEYRWWGR